MDTSPSRLTKTPIPIPANSRPTCPHSVPKLHLPAALRHHVDARRKAGKGQPLLLMCNITCRENCCCIALHSWVCWSYCVAFAINLASKASLPILKLCTLLLYTALCIQHFHPLPLIMCNSIVVQCAPTVVLINNVINPRRARVCTSVVLFITREAILIRETIFAHVHKGVAANTYYTALGMQ